MQKKRLTSSQPANLSDMKIENANTPKGTTPTKGEPMTHTTRQQRLAERLAELAKTATIIVHEDGFKINRSEIILGEGKDVDAKVRKALLQGKEITYKVDGRKEQIHDVMIFDSSKEGTDMYTWHKDGNRVAYKRTFVITHKDGTRTEEVLKTVWKVF